MIRECNVVAGGGREEIVGIGASGSTCKPALTKWRFNNIPGGLLIQGHLTGNSIPGYWFQWSSRTGGRLDRFHCIYSWLQPWMKKIWVHGTRRKGLWVVRPCGICNDVLGRK